MKYLYSSILTFILFPVFISFSQECTPGPLKPAATLPYTYAVTIPTENGFNESGNFTWYVTTDKNVITGAEVPATGSVIAIGNSGQYGKSTLSPGQKSLTITWGSDAITAAATNPYYLVVKYSQTINGCESSNLKVWKIVPMNLFYLAIEAVDNSGNAVSGPQCASSIVDATIDGDKVVYNYGDNVFYSKVTANNLSGEWTPSVKIPTLNNGQNIKELGWSTEINGTYHLFANAANSSGGEFSSTDKAVAKSDGSTPIYIKLVVSNGTWEGLSDQDIAISVDGVFGATGLKDVVGATNCNEEQPFGKSVIQKIKARPGVLTNTASGSPLAVPTPPDTNFIKP